jgi:hypothetical protein
MDAVVQALVQLPVLTAGELRGMAGLSAFFLAFVFFFTVNAATAG